FALDALGEESAYGGFEEEILASEVFRHTFVVGAQQRAQRRDTVGIATLGDRDLAIAQQSRQRPRRHQKHLFRLAARLQGELPGASLAKRTRTKDDCAE